MIERKFLMLRVAFAVASAFVLLPGSALTDIRTQITYPTGAADDMTPVGIELAQAESPVQRQIPASGSPAPINPNAAPYNASGSSHTTACDALANSNQLQCRAGSADFAIGQGIRIRGAGPASPLTPAGSLALSVNGTAGDTRYTYAVCTADPWRGIAGCAQQNIDNGPPTLTLANSISVTFARGAEPNAALFLVYRKIGSGSWRFVNVIPSRLFNDIGWTPEGPDGWPSSPPGRALNQDLWSTVRAVGTYSITLADNVPSSASNAIVMHDDTLAIQAAINAGVAAGRTVKFGPYTYSVNLPSVYSYASARFFYTFTRSSYGFFPQGLLQLPSNSRLLGSGRRATVLATDFMGTPEGQTATFDLSTGHHSNPFYIRDLTTRRLKAAPAGARIVTTITASDAGAFAPGDYVVVYGGAGLPAPYVSNELTRVIRADRASGNIDLADPLEKPLPLGTPGTPPSIANLNGEIVHDISIGDLTIHNYSPAFCNTSATMHVHMANIDVPFYSNGDFWYGGFRRDWTMDNLAVVSQREEFDLDEDVSFRSGSWLLYGDGMTADEGSSTIVWKDSRLTYNELFCSRPRCGPNNPSGGIGAHMSVSNWRVLGNTIRMIQALSNAAEGGWTLVQQGGIVTGYTPSGTVIQGNTIYTNARNGVILAGPVLGAAVSDNRLYMTPAAGAPVRAVQFCGGNLINNVVQIVAPPTRSTTAPIIAFVPTLRVPQPTRIEGNSIRVLDRPNYVHIAIADPGGPFLAPVTVSNNICDNSNYCVYAPAPSVHLPKLTLGGNVANRAAIAPLYRAK